MVRHRLAVLALLLVTQLGIACHRHHCFLRHRGVRINQAPVANCDCSPSYYPGLSHGMPSAAPVLTPMPHGSAIPTRMPTVTEQIPGLKPGPMPNL